MLLVPLAFSFNAIFNGIEIFFDRLRDVNFALLGLAAFLQILKLGCAGRVWQNSLAASYPDERVPFPMVFGASCAGAAVSSIVPARGGDAVRVVAVKRQVAHSTYTTVASTLLVRVPFDTLAAGAFFVFLLNEGVLPGHSLLPRRPAFDFSWFFGHPQETTIIVTTIALTLTALGLWAWETIQDFRYRVRQGLNALLDWRYYLRRVVPWQAADWSLRIVSVFVALMAFKMPATAYNALLVQGTTNLSTLLPISPSGIGTEQALLVSVLRGTASSGSIIAFSVGTRLMTIAVNVVLGFVAILFLFRTFRFRRYISEEQRKERAAKRRRERRRERQRG